MAPRAVPQTQIPHTSRLFQDFLYAYPRVSEFYPSPPFAPEGMRASAEAIRYPEPLRARVAEVLREPAEHAPAESATRRNLERFARPGCCAVVTGQQVGLFSGPAFTLYKALTAIKLAARLSEQGIEAVPVFWLATEDHDLAEVNHCYVQDREGKPVRLQYEEASRLEQAPVGTIRFNPSIRTVLDSLRAALPESDDARALLEQIEHCYRPGADFGEAFGSLLARLLWRYGVLMLASSDARLHRLARGVFRTAIECAGEISRELRGRNERLAQAGYHAQVRVAENSTVLFLHEGGRRSALHFEEGQFVSSRGNRYERAQLLEMLESDPALFSPSALLRPVMQDALLPTVAYVGGPSEIAYLAQSAVLYQRFLERMPVVFPRASFTILDPASSRLLEKYGMTLTDVFAGRQALREKMAAHFLPADLAGLFRKTAADLNAGLAAIQNSLQQLDPTLVDAAANSAQKMQYQLSHLERRAAAAVQKRTDQAERDATRLTNNLFPEKKLQERLYCGVSLLARFGLPLLERLYEGIPLDSGDHQILTP